MICLGLHRPRDGRLANKDVVSSVRKKPRSALKAWETLIKLKSIRWSKQNEIVVTFVFIYFPSFYDVFGFGRLRLFSRARHSKNTFCCLQLFIIKENVSLDCRYRPVWLP